MSPRSEPSDSYLFTTTTASSAARAAATAASWPPPVGSVHFWPAPPVHPHSCSGVPLAELDPVASRQSPWLVRVPAVAVHFWPAPPLQSYSWTLAPLAADPAVMHLPRARSVPSAPRVQFCALVALQS